MGFYSERKETVSSGEIGIACVGIDKDAVAEIYVVVGVGSEEEISFEPPTVSTADYDAEIGRSVEDFDSTSFSCIFGNIHTIGSLVINGIIDTKGIKVAERPGQICPDT